MKGSSCRFPRGDRRLGFTLIEVLAALLLTGLFVTAALPFAGQLVESWWTGQSVLASGDAWMQAIARLSDDLAEAVPYSLANGGNEVLAFRADDKTVHFVRPSLGASGPAVLQTETLSVESFPDGDRLVRNTRAFNAGLFKTTVPPTPGAPVLLRGSFHLRFVFIDSTGERRPSWENKDTLPLRVEMVVSAVGGARVPAASIVLPVAARSGSTKNGHDGL